MIFGNFIIMGCGAFDSNIKFPGLAETKNRLVEEYELEWFNEVKSTVSYINGIPHQLVQGSLICAKPGQVRRSKLPYRCYYLHLQTQDVALKQFLNSLPDIAPLPSDSGVAGFFKGFLQVCDNYQTDTHGALFLAQQVYGLLAFLCKALPGTPMGADQQVSVHQVAIMDIAEYIRGHIGEDLSLKVLAEKANLSPIYFHKLFTRYYGRTPNQYVADCRIAAAKLLLISSDCCMSAIADQCGFSTQNYFNAKFKEATGRSPLQYRKSMLSKITI